MNKEEAKKILDELNAGGRKCGYKNVVVNSHF